MREIIADSRMMHIGKTVKTGYLRGGGFVKRSGHNVMVNLGAHNAAVSEREENDYYATDPRAVEMLLERESFSPCIWEPACGEGHIARELERAGYTVYASDLIDRGYGAVRDFLEERESPPRRFRILKL